MRFLPIGIEAHHTCMAFVESTQTRPEESIAFQKEPVGLRTQICDYWGNQIKKPGFGMITKSVAASL